MERTRFVGFILCLVLLLVMEAMVQAVKPEEACSVSSEGTSMTHNRSILFSSSENGAGCGVELTYVPALGSTEDLSGVVVCDEPNECIEHKIAVYISIPPYGWWTKPYAEQPLTTVHSNCSFQTDITTGGRDRYAVKIMAFLVPDGNSAPVVLGEQCLPDSLFQYPYAETVRYRQISFAGYDWWIKRSCDISTADRVGPGPNYFTDSSENVWVDSQGHLHLRIVNVNGKWYCTEIIGADPLGYGTYLVTVQSRADLLDENIVFGFFTWEDCVPPHYRELDVELTRWSDPNEPNNLQYVVMPDWPGHKQRFNIDYSAGTNSTTHVITWNKGEVSFCSYYGDFSVIPPPEYLIASWSFTVNQDIPEAGLESPRINFWLDYGNPPNNGQGAEFIVTKFKYLADRAPRIDFADFALLANFWLERQCGSCGGADLDGNGDVNELDLKLFCENWLQRI
jgi:hypothetical protein